MKAFFRQAGFIVALSVGLGAVLFLVYFAYLVLVEMLHHV